MDRLKLTTKQKGYKCLLSFSFEKEKTFQILQLREFQIHLNDALFLIGQEANNISVICCSY